jgi:hypothetical protein
MGRPPIGKQAMSGAERTRRYREKFRHSQPVTKQPQAADGALAARVRELEAEIERLKGAQAKAARLDKLKPRLDELELVAIRELKAELARERARRKALAKSLEWWKQQRSPAATPKAEKPPLPPDEARDRQIKSLKTANQNLRQRLAWSERLAQERGTMSFKAMAAISKALHEDHEPTEAERGEAIRAFNAWKADANKARRK